MIDILAASLGAAIAGGAVPDLHRFGSIGTGDLVPLAELGLTLVGERSWRSGGAPVAPLDDGDALPFMSSNALTLATAGDTLQLTVQLPAALAHAPDVFAGDIRAAGGLLGTGLLGAGFALRLARAEARTAGGDLVREGLGKMILSLPLGSGRAAPHEAPHRTSVNAGS